MNNNVIKGNAAVKAFAYIVLGLYTLLVAYPLLFLVFTSLKTNKEFFVNLFGLPQHFEWSNYVNAWDTGKIGLYFGNSVLVTAVSVLITGLVALLGGYALAKLRIPHADGIMSAFMVFNFIPGIAIYISLYTMMSRMHLTGNHFTLILPYIAWSIPLAMYIIKQYFETIPQELIESGRIDGCNEFQNFLHIMLPLVTGIQELRAAKALIEEYGKKAMPKWIERAADSFEAKIVALPARDDIDYEVSENLIVEHYSR